jgi:hypothetical protein
VGDGLHDRLHDFFGTLSQEIGSKSQEIMRDDHHFKNGATELVTKEGMQMKIVRNRGSWYGKVNGEDQERPIGHSTCVDWANKRYVDAVAVPSRATKLAATSDVARAPRLCRCL